CARRDVLHFFFFFQAEDGIRDKLVTGVQTCALPILILCLGKTPQQIVEIAVRMNESHDLVLATRASRSIYQRLRKALDGKRVTRSEERRVGKEGRAGGGRGGADHHEERLTGGADWAE